MYFHTRKSSIRIFYFFFLMIRRPPRSTLFPTRRSSDLQNPTGRVFTRKELMLIAKLCSAYDATVIADEVYERSEEHTSELQSQSNLVCRLLLEKKKNTHSRSMSAYTKTTRADTCWPFR